MTYNGRKRGRPTGSGKDDTALLNAVAGKLLAHPEMKPSTAMKQVIAASPQPNTTPETLLRRLQVKWKAQSAVLMDTARAGAEAEARRIRERSIHQEAGSYGSGYIPRSFARELEGIQRMVDRITPNIGYLEKVQNALNPPGMSAVYKMMEEHRRIQDLIDPPHMQAIRKTIERMQRFGLLD
ncbi:hypothetical protein SAMN06297251_1445 [Fulvimarina manganoxydans]|uniref:Uncharacterized protein n=1 Tax=Fulvimarina manganoxydans TaxID=937218 RepID=A0A1W2EZ36_9HYPH|nr:hypothetical protein [Fulvimarina manganoxydans]SMD14914.1 hypothetical protein SAMN06297251_1445 [Fulvimarina manganoxydans]